MARGLMHRLLPVTLALAVCMAVGLAAAPPAHAEGNDCRITERWIEIPHWSPILVSVQLCVHRAGGDHAAFADQIEWNLPAHGTKPPKRFRKFLVEVQLRHHGHTVSRKRCNLIKVLNKYAETPNDRTIRCLPKGWNHSNAHGWTADGRLIYDNSPYEGTKMTVRGLHATDEIR